MKIKADVVDDIKEAQEFNKKKGYPPMYKLKKMPPWYGALRHLQANYRKAIWPLILVILASLLAHFFHKNK